ncbi:hypothetical protein NM208_g4331 [Fusarium decemcellulare]|uniref:Uncharacterized protein n=1 Tax=Fusarium decemcellulare TaxID=57161 RepID=A0ACC1SL60_9HYPO|nr:hypothetical protein NM208_g4331 [Fusarium decemcellulare]
MKLSMPLLFLMTSTAATTSSPNPASEIVKTIRARDCYSGGNTWAEAKPYVLYEAKAFCMAYLGNIVYNGRETRKVCFDIPLQTISQHAELEINRLGDSARWIDWKECFDGLQKEINGCDHGGKSRYTNWQYRADPNANPC